MLPDPGDRTCPPAGRASSGITHDDDTTSTDPTELDALRAEVGEQVLGCLLDRFPAEVAAGHLARLDRAQFPDPRHRYVLGALRVVVPAGVEFTPASVADAARQAGLIPPPGWRGLVLSELHELTSKACSPAGLGWHVDRLRVYAAEGAALAALLAAVAAVGRCDTVELAQVIQTQCGTALAVLAGVGR